MGKQKNPYHTFFYPENVAVVGVSPARSNLGKNIVFNLLTFGYQGEILSVGPKEGVVFGQRIYPSLDRIDRDIDMAVILTPAKTIPSILEQCGRKGISRAVIESGGFSEMGEDRSSIEKACVEIAKEYGIRFIGPNGIGVINMENGLAVPFMPMHKDLPLGKVSILAQSGGVALSYINFMSEENIGLNKFVSMGNKLNVTENDLLAYLIEDAGTEIILIYLEGFKDPRGFMEIASRSDKPILVHKSNRFQMSARIAQSHTTALFTDDRLVDHALEQAGCVRVNTLSDALDYIKILTLPPIRGNRLAVVSRSGGHAVIAADACGYYGFVLPPFPEEFVRNIEDRVRANVIRLQNPLDLGDLFDLTFYEHIVEELLKREDVDAVLLVQAYRRGYEQEDSRKLVDRTEYLMDTYKKPVALVVFTEAVEMAYLKRHSSIPVFFALENAMRALHLSRKWTSMKGRSERKPLLEVEPHGQEPVAPLVRRNPPKLQSSFAKASEDTRIPPRPGGRGFLRRRVNLSGAERILKEAGDREYLLLHESLELLRLSGFDIAPYRLAKSVDEAVQAFESLGRSVVMKLNRPHVSHKSEEGFVIINLQTAEDVRKTFNEFQKKKTGQDLEVLIQTMITEGTEVILGGKRDQAFGPAILFGLGGIFVEALEDVTWRLAPIDKSDARAMVDGIKGRKVLQGIRGRAPADIDAIEDYLLRLSALLTDLPIIKEIDINPVQVAGVDRGAKVLDARILLDASV